MTRASLTRYVAAAAAAGLALAVWYFLLKSLVHDPFPLLLFAVALASLFGGLWPGILSTAICGVGAYALYAEHNLPLSVFLLLALSLSWLNAPIRRMQNDLTEQVELTKDIAGNLPHGVLVLDTGGRATYVNPAAERLLGWTLRELRKKRIILSEHDEPVPGNAILPSRQLLPALHGTIVSLDRADARTKAGTSITLHVTAVPAFHGNIQTGTILSLRDVGEEIRVVEKLRKDQARFRTIVGSSPDGILTTDEYGFVTVANEHAATLFGFQDSDELTGRKFHELFAEPDRTRAAQARQDILSAGGVVSDEYLCARQNGSTFPAEVRSQVIVDDQGSTASVATIVRDIAGRVEHEERQKITTNRLRTQVAVLETLLDAGTPSDALWKILQILCQNSGWDVALFWEMDPEHRVLRCRQVWSMPGRAITGFAHLSRQIAPTIGSDLPGRVWLSNEPIWLSDAVTERTFARALVASQEGLHCGVAFPLTEDREVYGVIELFSTDVRPLDAGVRDALAAAGRHIGGYLRRFRREDENPLGAVTVAETSTSHMADTESPTTS